MKFLANVFGVIAILMWGSLALLAKQAQEIPPFLLLAICFFIAALILPISRLLQGKRPFRATELNWHNGLISIGSLLGFHACYFTALQFAPAIEVSLIAYLWPMLLALLLAGRHARTMTIIGGILGFVAIANVIGWHNISLESRFIKGYLLALACAIIWAFYSWYISRSNTTIDAMTWLCIGVSIGALSISFMVEPWQITVNYRLILAVILLGLGPVGGAFYLWDIALKQGSHAFVSALSLATPLISAALLALFHYTPWSPRLAMSLVLFIIAFTLINRAMQCHNLIEGLLMKLKTSNR